MEQLENTPSPFILTDDNVSIKHVLKTDFFPSLVEKPKTPKTLVRTFNRRVSVRLLRHARRQSHDAM